MAPHGLTSSNLGGTEPTKGLAAHSECPLEPAGVFNRIFAVLAGEAGRPDTLMIDATHHPETASS